LTCYRDSASDWMDSYIMSRNEPAKILIVDDSDAVRASVSRYLRELDYTVIEATDGIQGLKKTLSEKPDLLILDVVMPGMEGTRLCQIIRERGINTPIIMLTEKISLEDKVLGFSSGGDDYLAKPFSKEELELRIRALLRRSADRSRGSGVGSISVGDMEIDFDRHKVTEGGRDVVLTPTEFRILELLASTPGRAYSRHELLNYVWDSAFEGYKRNIDPHVNRLRNKLEPNPNRPTYILTVWGIGYKLNDALPPSSDTARHNSI